MPVRSLQHADLSPKAATDLGNRRVELAAQAQDGQVVHVDIVVGGAVGASPGPRVAAELSEEVEDQ